MRNKNKGNCANVNKYFTAEAKFKIKSSKNLNDYYAPRYYLQIGKVLEDKHNGWKIYDLHQDFLKQGLDLKNSKSTNLFGDQNEWVIFCKITKNRESIFVLLIIPSFNTVRATRIIL